MRTLTEIFHAIAARALFLGSLALPALVIYHPALHAIDKLPEAWLFLLMIIGVALLIGLGGVVIFSALWHWYLRFVVHEDDRSAVEADLERSSNLGSVVPIYGKIRDWFLGRSDRA